MEGKKCDGRRKTEDGKGKSSGKDGDGKGSRVK